MFTNKVGWGDDTNLMDVGITVINNFFPSCNSPALGSILSAKYLVISNRDLELNHIFKSGSWCTTNILSSSREETEDYR